MNDQTRRHDTAGGGALELAEFRIGSPAEIVGLLEELVRRRVPLALSTPDGGRYTTAMQSLEPARGLLCLAAGENDHQLHGLLESEEVCALAYLDSIKLQFDLHDLVLVHGSGGCALNARFPRELYRFQRRASFRVRPLINTRPTATLLHPLQRDAQLELRVLDVSIGGVALFLPDGAPAIEPGVLLEDVLIELDGDTRLAVGLVVHHVTLLHQESKGVRLGCELLDLGGEGARALQRYIDHTQKRRRLLVL